MKVSDEHKKLNPKGEVPVNIDSFDQLPIIEYFDETHPTPRLLEENSYQRYQV